MKIRYVSSFSVKSLHGMINRSLLKMLCDMDFCDVECYATRSSVDMLKAAVGDDSVKKWHSLRVVSSSSRIALLMRYLISAFYNILILLKSKRGDLLFYNFNNVFSLKLIDLINRRLHRDIIVCCHGEMEYLMNSGKHTRKYKKLMSRLTNSYFNTKRRSVAPGLHFVVFGDVIKDNLKSLVSPELMSRIHSMDHPVENGCAKAKVADIDTVIGTVGIMNYYKGSELYPMLVRKLQDVDGLRFKVVGHMQCDADPFVQAGIGIPAKPYEPLEKEMFMAEVATLDYLLFLYPPDTYRLIASGAILDSIRFKRPVIGFRTEYFDYIFRKYGCLGYLVDTESELIELLKKPEALNRSWDFDSAAARLSPMALLPELREIIHNVVEHESHDA